MCRLVSNYSRFILNNVVRDVLCHKLYSSIYERNNSFSYYFVILFFNSNLENFGYKLFYLFVCKSCISESRVFLTGLFFFVETIRVLWLFFGTWCSRILFSISRKSFWFQFFRYSSISDLETSFLTFLSRVSIRCLGLNTCREILLYFVIVSICIVFY